MTAKPPKRPTREELERAVLVWQRAYRTRWLVGGTWNDEDALNDLALRIRASRKGKKS